MGANDRLGDGQSQPCMLAAAFTPRRIGTVKTIKQSRQQLSSDSRSGVFDADTHVARRFFDKYLDGSATRRVTQGVIQQVGQRAAQHAAIALRYTPGGGAIKVLIEETASHVRISIENTGAGIAAELLPRLFDRFYRADPARREGSSEHAGLGLAITQSIIRAHGGQIRCEAQEGVTRFVLELPAIKAVST